MSCEHKERNGARMGALNKEKLMIDRGPVLRREELHLKRNGFGRDR